MGSGVGEIVVAAIGIGSGSRGGGHVKRCITLGLFNAQDN